MVHPLDDEAVGDGVFGRKPEDGGLTSPGRSLDLQGGGDLLQTEPASVLQLRMVHVYLDDKQHPRSHDTAQVVHLRALLGPLHGSHLGLMFISRLKPLKHLDLRSVRAHLSVGGANRGMAAQHEGAVRKRPVLRGAVGDAVDLQTHLLRHLPAQSLLQSLTCSNHRETVNRLVQ